MALNLVNSSDDDEVCTGTIPKASEYHFLVACEEKLLSIAGEIEMCEEMQGFWRGVRDKPGISDEEYRMADWRVQIAKERLNLIYGKDKHGCPFDPLS